MVMMYKWILTNTITGYEIVYNDDEFNFLEHYCKQIIEDVRHEHYSIALYRGDELMETVKLTDYFNI